jgi:16S rRNA processing protein RimM
LRDFLEDGSELGILSDIFATGSNDVYVVKGQDREFLIPALEEVVKVIDLATGTMKVAPLEGLLDL